MGGGIVYGEEIKQYAEFYRPSDVAFSINRVTTYSIPLGSKIHVKATSEYVGLVDRVEILVVGHRA